MANTHIKSVFNVSNLAWDILKTVKKEKLQILELNAKKFNTRVIHKENILTIQWDSKKEDDDEEIRMCAEVLTCYCYVIRDKELGEIRLDQHSADTQKWCEEIEAIIETKCCLYVPEQNKVLVFCNTYEDLQIVKHHFLVKKGKMKTTRRSSSRRVRTEIQSFEAKQHVYNTISLSHASDLLASSEDYNMTILNTGFAKGIKTYKTNEGIVVKVYEASIVNLPVDCIVNSADEFLLHDIGIAKIIKEAAGEELKMEGNKLLEKNDTIPVGHACTTTAGQLPYKCIIHAVGPRWDDYRPHDLDNVKEFEMNLYLAIMCSMYEAEKRGICSIAFPPISAGISDEPEELCIYQYAKVVVDYSRKSVAAETRLREIHFVDIQPSVIRKIQIMFAIMIQDKEQRGRCWPNDGATSCPSTAS